MAIKLFSGLPGAGKSLSLVAELVEMHKREPGRPVYAHGIDGLREGLAQSCDPLNWQDLPDGSIVVVDEAQKVWPSGRRGVVPPNIAAFSEHRHRGFDFLLATQSPSFLDGFVRGLVDQHTHIVRRWGSSTVDRYVWQEGVDDPKSQSMRARAQRSRWRYPRDLFDFYKSSTLHTVKRRLPWQWWLMVGSAVVAVPICLYAWHRLHTGVIQHPAPVSVGGVSSSFGGESRRVRWATTADYVRDHLPRVANQPWSAPVFDQEPIQAHPDLYCIEYHVPGQSDPLCACYTEQVTPYDLHDYVECRRYARDGVYNPRRAPFVPPASSAELFAGRRRSARSDSVDESSAGSVSSPSAFSPAWRTQSYIQPGSQPPYQPKPWGGG